jgi:hypothetical protein
MDDKIRRDGGRHRSSSAEMMVNAVLSESNPASSGASADNNMNDSANDEGHADKYDCNSSTSSNAPSR